MDIRPSLKTNIFVSCCSVEDDFNLFTCCSFSMIEQLVCQEVDGCQACMVYSYKVLLAYRRHACVMFRLRGQTTVKLCLSTV